MFASQRPRLRLRASAERNKPAQLLSWEGTASGILKPFFNMDVWEHSVCLFQNATPTGLSSFLLRALPQVQQATQMQRIRVKCDPGVHLSFLTGGEGGGEEVVICPTTLWFGDEKFSWSLYIFLAIWLKYIVISIGKWRLLIGRVLYLYIRINVAGELLQVKQLSGCSEPLSGGSF